MKKLIFSAAVLASAFFAASCQQEMLDPQAEGTTVTYTVEVPDAIATKATGDGFTLHYEVYRQDYMNETAPVYKGTKEFLGGKATVELEFVKDQEFHVLFWAQQTTGAQAYNITDLRAVSLNTLVANDLTAEVFAGNDHVVDCKSDNGGNVVLVRPVAQLNIATTAESFTLGNAGSTTATVKPTQSKVVVNGLYGTYNVADGTVDTKASRTYTEADVLGSDFKNTYKLMATNYLGFIPQAGDNVEVTFTIYTENDGNIEHTVSNVPVKANYQTNILGNLISATADYQVTLEDWADAGKDMEVLADGIVKNINGDYEISTAKGLAYAICNVFANGGTFYVLNNIDMTGVSYDPADVPAGTTVHIVGEAPVVTRSSSSVVITGLTKPLLKTVQEGAAASFANIYIEAPIDFVQINNGVVAFNNCDNTATDSEDDLVGDNTNGTIAEEGTNINNLALKEALDAEASSIKLAGDITASEIIVVDYPVTIDGCGHKLTSSAGRAINVSGADGVTIKNLVIECTGERAINIIQNATNVTIDNVTATASNYTVNVATSAPGAVVNIVNSTLNGLCTVNVASPEAVVTVDNSTINCNDNNTTVGESYAALCLNKDAVGGKIEVTNSTINVVEGSDSRKAKNGAEDGIITIDGSAEEVSVQVAAITFEDAYAYYSFTSLEDAIAYAQEYNRPVTLIRDLNVAETITIEEGQTVVLDLNGKTLSNPNGYAIENYSELTITGEGYMAGLGGIRSHAGKVTIEDGTFTASSKWSEGTFQHILKAVNTEAIINGGKFDATIGGITNAMINVSENSTVTINGGEFRNVVEGEVIPQFAPYMFTYEKNGKLIINDGSFYGGWRFNGETATTDIKGGDFTVSYDGQSFHANSTHVLTIYGGTFSLENGGKLDPSKHVAEGYKAVQNADGKWEVVEKTYVAQIGEEKYESLQEAFNAGGEITLLCDVTISEPIELAADKAAVLDLNGKTITAAGEDGYAITNMGELTIKNNGVINGVVYAEGPAETIINGGTYNALENAKYVLLNSAGASLTINAATINGGSSYPIYSYDAYSKLVVNDATVNATFGCVNSYGTNGLVEINGGTFNMTGVQGKTSHIAYFSNVDAVINGGTFNKIGDINMSGTGGGGICAINGAALTINNGTFAGDHADVYNWGGTDKNNNGRSTSIAIKGGTYKFDPTSFLADGYKAQQDSKGWSVVQE